MIATIALQRLTVIVPLRNDLILNETKCQLTGLQYITGFEQKGQHPRLTDEPSYPYYKLLL